MKQYTALFTCLTVALTSNASVIINEIMQSNVDCLFINHEFPDSWVELYNPESTDASLSGWKISDSDDPATAYPLSGTIPAKGHILIYCDKEDSDLHTNFRLESGSGDIYLFNPSGNIADHLAFKKQPAPNIAYARTADAANPWAYFITATPNAANSGTYISDKSNILPQPIFNQDGFVSVQGSDPFTLIISIPDGVPDDTKLCVTTDGSEPTADNAITNSANVWYKYINSTTVVRAKLISNKALPIRSTTQSYIYLPEETKLPVFSLVGDPDFFYSNDEGILMGEYDDNDPAKQNPNWNHDWRRPINIEYFQGEDHNPLFNQVGETRVHGAYSRRNAQKSLAIYANKRFGTKRFYGNLWHEKQNVSEVKSFVLRNGGNCFEASRINDQVGQSIIGRNVDNLDWQAYEPSIYFLNGKYMGLADLRERSNDDNVLANYGIEDIDMIENWNELKNGTWDNFNDFIDYCNSDNVTFDGLNQRMDIDNFLNMFIIKSFGMDTDFPNNNISLWRPREDGGRWRFMLKDLDRMGLQWMDYEIGNDLCSFIDDMINSNTYYARVLRVFPLIYNKIPETKNLYIDRMAIYLGDFLRTGNGQDIIDEFIADIEPEYLRHLQVYFNDVPNTSAYRYSGDWGWKGYVNYFRNTWWSKRKANMFNILKSRFNLGSVVVLNMEQNNAPVTFNDVSLQLTDKYYGKWFAGREMRLKTSPGHEWRVTTTTSSGQQSVNTYLDSSFSYTPASNISSIKVEVLENSTGGIKDIINDGSDLSTGISVSRQESTVTLSSQLPILAISAYDLFGRQISSLNTSLSISSNSDFYSASFQAPYTHLIIVVTTPSGTTSIKL